jgi:hypothetical protein
MRNRTFHAAGDLKRGVTYRNGEEVQPKNSFTNRYGAHLTTNGEFGPILIAVLNDAARSKLEWSGWEQSKDDVLAVFRFDVAADKSHYSVHMPTVSQQDRRTVPYGGEIAVRPADGAIERLTVMAHMAAESDVRAANIMVEYGPMEIGGKIYLCPVHGVGMAKVPITRVRAKQQNASAPLQTQVNDVVFENYHVFRSDVRFEQGQKN